MDWRNLHGVIDVSPFMLFESTGDSEEDSDQAMSSFDDDTMDVSYHEVDDAQSCSSEISGDYDVRDHFTSTYSNNNSQEYLQHQDENDHYDNDEDEEEEEEEDGVIDQVCSRRKLGFVFSKNKVYADSTIEPLKKEENDKLFWDTCLAS